MQVSGKQPIDCIGNKMETYRKTLDSYCVNHDLTYEEISEYLNDDELFELLDYVEIRLSCEEFDNFLDAVRQYE